MKHTSTLPKTLRRAKKFPSYLFACLWAVITIYPLVFTVLSSLKNNTEIFSDSALRLPQTLRFENYENALVVGNMARSLLNSIVIAGCATVVVLLLASMVGFAISRFNPKITRFIYMFFTLGLLVPVHSTLVPLYKIVNQIKGPYDSYPVIIIIYATFNLPLAILIMTSGMRAISRSLDESAIIDGCGPFRVFGRIVLPLTLPSVSTVGIITFLYVYNDLLFAVLFISSKENYTVTKAMQTFVGSKITTYGPIFASIIVAIIPMIVIYLLLQSKVEKGLAAGAIKG